MEISQTQHPTPPSKEMLECSICLKGLHIIQGPQTLQRCSHTFCKECIDDLIRKQSNNPPGVKCPVCRVFSGVEEIGNVFRKDLAQMYINSLSEPKATCELCMGDEGPIDAYSRCVTCSVDLCKQCKPKHLTNNIGLEHKIVQLPEQTDLNALEDQLAFCDQHNTMPIDFLCCQCNILICVECKATDHNEHKTKTTKEIFGKLVPEIQSLVSGIEESIHTTDKAIDDMDAKTKQIQIKFDECRKQVHETANKRIEAIRSAEKQLTDSINQKQHDEVKKINDVKSNLKERQRVGKNLKQVVCFSLEKGRPVILLHGGLQEKIKTFTSKIVTQPLSLHTEISTFHEDQSKEETLGTVEYKKETVEVVVNNINQFTGYSYCSYDFKKLTNLQKCVEFNVNSDGVRFMNINEEIWIPDHTAKINIYNLTGTFLRDIAVQAPQAVEVAHNNDIFVATNVGIYMVKDKSSLLQLCSGSYSDICSYRTSVFALEYKRKVVEEYITEEDEVNPNWVKCREVQIKTEQHDPYNTLLFVNSDGDLYFYIASHSCHTIYKYNDQGQVLKQYGKYGAGSLSSLKYPYLCAIDSGLCILVADSQNMKYKILDTKTDKWSSAKFPSSNYVFDAKVDKEGSLWLLQQNDGGTSFITKYTVS